jgi:hypothetical protein
MKRGDGAASRQRIAESGSGHRISNLNRGFLPLTHADSKKLEA